MGLSDRNMNNSLTRRGESIVQISCQFTKLTAMDQFFVALENLCGAINFKAPSCICLISTKQMSLSNLKYAEWSNCVYFDIS